MPRRTLPAEDVIAERRLMTRSHPRRAVVVSLGRPRQTEADHWECPFRISGAGTRLVESGRGIDAFQALTLALERIRHALDRLETPVVWDGVFDDHSGFNRSIPWIPEPRRGDQMSIRKGTMRLERIVDREVRRWALDMKRRYHASQKIKARTGSSRG